MNDDKLYIKPTTTSNDSVRIQEDSKKPTGAVNSSRSFKKILDKEDEDRAASSGKISGKKSAVDDEEESDSGQVTSYRGKAEEDKEGENMFSLFGSQRGKGVQKQPTLQPGADINEDPTIAENQAEVTPFTPQQTSGNATAGTQVKTPKFLPRNEEQSLLETTFRQTAPLESQEKPKSLTALKEQKPVQRSNTGQGESSRVKSQEEGSQYGAVQWDDEENTSGFSYQNLPDEEGAVSNQVAFAANPKTSLSLDNKPVTFNVDSKQTELPVPLAQIKPKDAEIVTENPLAYQQLTPSKASPGVAIPQNRIQPVSAEETLAGEVSVKTKSTKENVPNPFPQEHVDLSSINPQGLITPVAGIDVSNTINTAAAPKPMPASATMYVLLDVLVKEISTMTLGDKTETTITLQRPPLFANAQVQITTFGSAKGELNITFANLTQNAQHVIEQQQQNLLLALETKGYNVHILTATTIELQSPVASANADQQQQQRQPGNQQGRNRQNKDQEERET